MPTVLERFVYAVGAEVDDASMNKAEKSVDGLINVSLALAGAATAAFTALFGLVKVTADNADTAIKSADALGLTVEQYQRLDHVAGLNGISTSKFSIALERMVRRLAEAVNGSGEAASAIDDLGISTEKLNSLNTNEKFLLIADALNSLDSESEKVRLGFRIFGRNTSDLLLMMRGGASMIRATGKEMDVFGLITEKNARLYEKFNDDLSRLWKIFKGITIQISNGVLPVFLKIIDETKKWLVLNRAIVGSRIERFLMTLTDLLTGVWVIVKSLGVSLMWVLDTIGGFDKAMQLLLSMGIAAFLVTTITGFVALGKAITGAGVATAVFGGIMKATKILLLIGAIEDIIAWVRGGNSIIGSLIGSFPDFLRDFDGMFDEILASWDSMVDAMVVKFKGAIKDMTPSLPSSMSAGGIVSKAESFLLDAINFNPVQTFMDYTTKQAPVTTNNQNTSNVQNINMNFQGDAKSSATLAVDELRAWQQQMQSGVK